MSQTIRERNFKLNVRPIAQKAANAYITENHRHHGPVRGWKFGVSLRDEQNDVIAVMAVGRPVARPLDDGLTLEVTRLCTDGTENACSKLYAIARRVAFDLGYERVFTYILESELGTSLKAAGWEFDGIVEGRSWNCPSRPRTDKHPTENKQRWKAVKRTKK